MDCFRAVIFYRPLYIQIIRTRMERPKHKTTMLPSGLFLFFTLFVFAVNVQAQTLPPAKIDGFVYENIRVNSDTIIIEAFYDPVCPDSRDSWPPLKQALSYYGSRAWLVVHLFPLPSVIPFFFPLIIRS
jgi:hypothetical protein